MKTIDRLLAEIVNYGVGKLDQSVPTRDKKILISLDKQIHYGNFLTKNQGDLLVKILKENESEVKKVLGNDITSLTAPTWSNPFRVIQPVKKIYRKKDSLTHFVVEFTWNKRLQQCMIDLNKDLQGGVSSSAHKIFTIPLTEKNIYLVVNKLKPLKFEISEDIATFYEEICEIVKKNLLPNELKVESNTRITSALTTELGAETLTTSLLLRDRQIRYQYVFSDEKTEDTLSSKIANRSQHKIWIKESKQSLTALVQSLKELERFPLLVILNGHESNTDLKNLENLITALDNTVTYRPNVYFRFDNNSEQNVKFNTFVNEHNLNHKLDPSIKVAVLANNKLPKFLFSTNWYPRSVITFTNNFRSNKTSTWCDAVDLQIYYNEKQPIIGGADAIL